MSPRTRHSQIGAALLLAMIIVTLVSTIAAGMVWQQSRAIHIEAAERARAQVGWMLHTGIDFAREVVRRFDDANPQRDQPWDADLAETRLSALLAADRDNSADASLDAFISGRISDAQSRYNLHRLVGVDGKLVEVEAKAFTRLCEAIGLPDSAAMVMSGLVKAHAAQAADRAADAAIAPTRVEQLIWLGVDPASLARLMEFVELLPVDTPVNLNTARREVIYAAIDGISLSDAERLVRVRATRFASIEQLVSERLLAPTIALDPGRVSVKTSYFVAEATVRFEDNAITERALLERQGAGASATVVVRRSERFPLRAT